MIPALLAAPMVQGIVGSIAGSVAGTVSSLFSSPTAPAPSASFNPYLQRASEAASAATFATPSGSMTATDWSQLSPTDLQSWMKGLSGKYVHATDVSGRTVSGVVNGLVQNGGIPALNVGGHLVSLSQVNQITWSPAIH